MKFQKKKIIILKSSIAQKKMKKKNLNLQNLKRKIKKFMQKENIKKLELFGHKFVNNN